MTGMIKRVKFGPVHDRADYLKYVDSELHGRGLIVDAPDNQGRCFQAARLNKLQRFIFLLPHIGKKNLIQKTLHLLSRLERPWEPAYPQHLLNEIFSDVLV